MPVFMIGTQRSGSNLLRLMLNQLPDIASPHPPHIMERLGPLEADYGDLGDDANWQQLREDVCGLVETNPVAWEGVSLDRADVDARCRERSLVALFGAVYEILAETWGKHDWMCKSLANVHYLPQIEAYFGDSAKYLYLYREGRDVALSFRKALIGDKTFYHLGKVWHQEQQLALACRERVKPEQFFMISYEQLTSDPEPQLRALCDFLGAEYTPAMLDFHQSAEAGRTAVAALWSNVTRPVDAGNTGKYLREASEEDIRTYEWVAGETLDTLGYPRHFSVLGEGHDFSADELATFDAENARLKRLAREGADPKDLELRRPQEQHLTAIRERLFSNKSNAA